jgi:hypothetical protein
MTHCLPPSLLRLFKPRDPLPIVPPLDRDFTQRRGPIVDPIAPSLRLFEECKDIPRTSVFVAPQIRKRNEVNSKKNLFLD